MDKIERLEAENSELRKTVHEQAVKLAKIEGIMDAARLAIEAMERQQALRIHQRKTTSFFDWLW